MAWRAEFPDHKEQEKQFLRLAREKNIGNLTFIELPIKRHHEIKRRL